MFIMAGFCFIKQKFEKTKQKNRKDATQQPLFRVDPLKNKQFDQILAKGTTTYEHPQ